MSTAAQARAYRARKKAEAVGPTPASSPAPTVITLAQRRQLRDEIIAAAQAYAVSDPASLALAAQGGMLPWLNLLLGMSD